MCRYLALVYLYSAQGGSLMAFFSQPQNAQVVHDAFKAMEAVWITYDADRSRRLSYDELSRLMSTELPNVWAAGQAEVEEFFPPSARTVWPASRH